MPNNRTYRAKGRRWRKVRRKALQRAGYRCERCGAGGGTRKTTRQWLRVHHKRPLAAGGPPYDQDNLEALCPACEDAEHGRGDPGLTLPNIR